MYEIYYDTLQKTHVTSFWLSQASTLFEIKHHKNKNINTEALKK